MTSTQRSPTALVRFFETAFAKDAKQRHGTAADMLAEWRNALAASVATTPEDADEVAERATPDTLLPQSGLTPRALSALEPFRLKTVGDLAALDTSRLSRFTGIVDATKREIRGRAKQWREKFADELPATTVADESVNQADPFTAPEIAAQLLVESAGSTRAQARRTAAAVLLGLEGDVEPFAVLADLASALGLGGQPQVSAALAAVRDAWAKSAQAAALLDTVFDRVVGVLGGFDGAAWTDSIVDALAPSTASPEQRRLIAGMVRAALDRAEDKAKGADEESPIVRRRRRRDNRLLIAHSAEVADAAGPLGVRASQLVGDAVEGGEFVVPRGRSVPAFRQLWASGLPSLDDTRLIRLAARLSDGAAASASGELYSTSMPVVDAVRLALGSTMPSQRFTVEEIRRLVQVRFPGVSDVPSRPGLDRVLTEAGTGLTWSGDGYSVPSSHSDTTFVTQTTYPAIPVRTLERDGHPSSRHLRESISARSFLALGVPAKHADRIAAGLVELLRSCRGQRDRCAAGVTAGECREGRSSLGRGARCGRFDAGVRGRAGASRARGPGCPSHRSGYLRRTRRRSRSRPPGRHHRSSTVGPIRTHGDPQPTGRHHHIAGASGVADRPRGGERWTTSRSRSGTTDLCIPVRAHRRFVRRN